MASSLNRARVVKEDEFYTRLEDIEQELKHYRKHFAGKVVYCNCDDPRESNFFRYFSLNFERLGLKKLVTTCYSTNGSSVYLEYEGDKNGNLIPDEVEVKPLICNGDFRSPESIELLRQSDIVVTNPPFSLFREFVSQLMEHDKKFIILGNQNAAKYKEIFPLIQADKMWLGNYSGDMAFCVPDHYEPRETRYWQDENGQKWRSLGNICWFTNLGISKRHEEVILYKEYSPEEYPIYDNYDAINIDRYKLIPKDYEGVMGVPITYLTSHNPDQFEIVGKLHEPKLRGKGMYTRVLIRNRNPEKE